MRDVVDRVCLQRHKSNIARIDQLRYDNIQSANRIITRIIILMPPGACFRAAFIFISSAPDHHCPSIAAMLQAAFAPQLTPRRKCVLHESMRNEYAYVARFFAVNFMKRLDDFSAVTGEAEVIKIGAVALLGFLSAFAKLSNPLKSWKNIIS